MFEHDESSIIVERIIKGDFGYVLQRLCKMDGNAIIINHHYFKHLASPDTYEIIHQYVTARIDFILQTNPQFTVHVNLKRLSMIDFDKHKQFIKTAATIFKERYPNKLQQCHVYDAPYFFSHIYNFVSLFVDKDTLSKIHLVP